MSYASRAGRARVNHTAPEAQAVCQRCGIWTNRSRLRNQFDWRGAALQPLYLYVCGPCYDRPQEQLRAIVVAADPVPVYLPFVEPFLTAETDYMTVGATTTDAVTGIPIPPTTTLTTAAGDPLMRQPVGTPVGLDQRAIMNGTLLPVLSIVASGVGSITVTCESAHGLATDDQVSVEGATDVRANGFYSVTVTTATAFTYTPVPVLSFGSLLGARTRVVTAAVGVPRGFDQIPQV